MPVATGAGATPGQPAAATPAAAGFPLAGSVGVVVPNYNYARYLPGRLSSIMAQGGMVGRLAFLDDASTDDSLAVAEPLLARFACPVTVLRNAVNSGSVFRQWARGLESAETPFLWIAEADDGAEPGMLEALAQRLVEDESAVFAFSDSVGVGSDDAVVAESTKAHASALGDHVLDRDATLAGPDFLRRCLCPRNLVVSASAVLWRTQALRAALESLGDGIDRWRVAGDWRIYAEAASSGGPVHYDARPFNRHRRHAASVTGALPRPRHFAEVVAMHATLRRLLGRDTMNDERMRRHLVDLRRSWELA
jgi:glycosyltransferase involved in cell wall biosynthesis